MYRRPGTTGKIKGGRGRLVLPISLIVLAICFVLVPVDTGMMLSFVLATALLILGVGMIYAGRGDVHEQDRQLHRRQADQIRASCG